MKPLIVLISAFAISLFATKVFHGAFEWGLAARVAMSVMLVFTAVAHFAFTKGMAMMLPDFIPFKNGTVFVTGLIELAAAIGLLIPGLRLLTAWLLILFFILILPSNIYAAIKHVDYQKGTFEGKGLTYLWLRIPLQVFYIFWVFFSAVKG